MRLRPADGGARQVHPLTQVRGVGSRQGRQGGTGDCHAVRRAEVRARRRTSRRFAHQAVQGYVRRGRGVRAAHPSVEGRLQRDRPGEGQGAVRGAGVPRGARARGG